jgi:hypothetical protein
MAKKILMSEVFVIKEAIPAGGGSGHSYDIVPMKGGQMQYKDPHKIKRGSGGQSDFQQRQDFSKMTAHSDETAEDMLNHQPEHEYDNVDVEDYRGKTLQDLAQTEDLGEFVHEYMTDNADGNYYIQTDATTFGVTGIIIDQPLFDELKDMPKLGYKMTGAMHKAGQGY